MPIRVIFLVLSLSAFPFLSNTKDANAVALLKQTLQVHGGRPVSGWELTGSLVNPKDGATVGGFILHIRGDDFAFISVRNGQVTSFLRLHGQFSVREKGATRHLPGSSEMTADIIPQLTTWVRFDDEGASVSPATVKDRGGHTVYEITVDAPAHASEVNVTKHSTQQVRIDPTTALVQSVTYTSSGASITNSFYEYRTLNGMHVPTRVEKAIQDRPVITYIITSVKSTAAISDQDLLGAIR